jgi:hypothetical protein
VFVRIVLLIIAVKGLKSSIPIRGLWSPEGSGRLRFPDSVTSALEGGSLSALRIGRLYIQEYSGTHFKRLSRPQTHGIVWCHGKNPGTFRLVA